MKIKKLYFILQNDSWLPAYKLPIGAKIYYGASWKPELWEKSDVTKHDHTEMMKDFLVQPL